MRKIKITSALALIALFAAVAVVTLGAPVAKAEPPDPCFGHCRQ